MTSTTRAAYSLAEAGELLGGVSRAHLYNLAKQDQLRFVRIGRRVMVPASEIDRLAAAGATLEPATESATTR